MDAERLIALEKKFAPKVGKGQGVFSPLDRNPHAPWNLGGDKMGRDRNNYAEVYARLLTDFVPQRIVELGVFQGASMAVWCELFPEADVIGLDLSFDRYHANLFALKERGAFKTNSPLLHEWDAYSDEAEFLRDLGDIDLFIDDGPHTQDAIENVLGLVGPLMAPGGIYVVEDFPEGDRLLAKAFPQARIVCAGRLNAALL